MNPGASRPTPVAGFAMNSSVPPLRLLLAFEACARHASFARAAAELNITPSAVSHRIANLEKNVGEALFARQLLVPSLTAFRAAHPAIDIELSPAWIGVLAERVTLAIPA